MKENQDFLLPRPLFSKGHYGKYLPHALSVIANISYKEPNHALLSGELGPDLYMMLHEFIHFWQLSCSSYGMYRLDSELSDQPLKIVELWGINKEPKLPLQKPDYSKISQTLSLSNDFRSRTDSWDGYNVELVSPSSDNYADRVAHDSESEPPTWYLPLEDSNMLIRLPIGTRTLLECAAEIIGRTRLSTIEAINRQAALMPYRHSAFPHSSSYWHYSGAHVYFTSVLYSEHKMDVKERDGLFLDIVDLSLLIPGINGETDILSPGHRFLYLTKATSEALKSKRPDEKRTDLIRRIFSEAGYGDYNMLCHSILERKEKLIKGLGGRGTTIFGPVYGQLLAYFKRAMELRLDDPTTFGSALLTHSGQLRLFLHLPPPLIFFRDNWWAAPKWWIRPGEDKLLNFGQGYNPALSNLYITSIVDQAFNQNRVKCPLRALDVGTPCGCDFERSGLPVQVPTEYRLGKDKHCHFLSLWNNIIKGYYTSNANGVGSS